MDVLDFIWASAGLLFVFIVPGLAASFMLFPRVGEVGFFVRVTLAVGLSVALSILPVMFLSYFGVVVNDFNVALTILCVTLACVAAAFFRVRGVKPWLHL